MAAHNETGRKGEEAAREMLLSKGYTIRHTNWKIDRLELDIVAEKGNLLVVVEVKTREKVDYGNPWEFVTNDKIRKIIRATHHYIHIFNINTDVRFDVVSVLKHGESYIPEHIEDAFYPPVW